jgi:hypothetical protein
VVLKFPLRTATGARGADRSFALAFISHAWFISHLGCAAMRSKLVAVAKALNYLIVVAAVCIVLDMVLLRATYPWHYRSDNADRYPFPYEMFRGKPDTGDNNADGFRGRLFRNDDPDAFRIAFYGGSTGYFGSPPIAETLEQELARLWNREVRVYNFSVISSNHRQHVHGMVENLVGRKVDVVVFYGGANELFLPRYFDPRPGYPYNYFYRDETSPLNKALLEHSAFFALINKVFDRRNIDTQFNLTPLVHLRKTHDVTSEAWEEAVLDKYMETLALASTLSGSIASRHCGKAVFLAFFQPMNYSKPEDIRLVAKARARIKGKDDIIDASDAFAKFGPGIYFDGVHVAQPANDWMGQTMAEAITASPAVTSRCAKN